MLVRQIQRESKDATDRVKVSRSKPTGVGSGSRKAGFDPLSRCPIPYFVLNYMVK